MNWLNEMLQNDPDPEWIESLKAVIDHDGAGRAHQLLEGMVELTRRAGAYLPFDPTTELHQHHPPHMEAKMPGDAAMEWRIRSMIRWNAMAMVVRANRKPGELGGHIASFASSATLYDVGFNHFWRAPAPTTRATCCTSRATARPASTRAPSSKAASASRSSTTSAWKSTARASAPIRTRG
jgi:pyruvate dehydrogenase E1 component